MNYQYNRHNQAFHSGLPNMSNTLNGWEVPLSLKKIKQSIVDGDAVKTEETINFQGVFQPLREEQLQSKPEGQRSWAWYWIHAKAGTLNLSTQDKIIFNNVKYKVMAVKDYTLYGYIEYQIVADYE